jgi:hypothetical protein
VRWLTPSNHGTDRSGPEKAGTILADARAADFIPPFAGLHEFRERNLSSRFRRTTPDCILQELQL